MHLKSVALRQPPQIGTDMFQFMSVAPTTPQGTERLELMVGRQPPFPFVAVTYRGTVYSVPLSNVSAYVLRKDEQLDPVEMTTSAEELGVDVPSGFCSCGAKHWNFEKVCKACSLPIFGRGGTDGNEEEDDQKEGLIGEGPPGELVGGESLPDVEF